MNAQDRSDATRRAQETLDANDWSDPDVRTTDWHATAQELARCVLDYDVELSTVGEILARGVLDPNEAQSRIDRTLDYIDSIPRRPDGGDSLTHVATLLGGKPLQTAEVIDRSGQALGEVLGSGRFAEPFGQAFARGFAMAAQRRVGADSFVRAARLAAMMDDRDRTLDEALNEMRRAIATVIPGKLDDREVNILVGSAEDVAVRFGTKAAMPRILDVLSSSASAARDVAGAQRTIREMLDVGPDLARELAERVFALRHATAPEPPSPGGSVLIGYGELQLLRQATRATEYLNGLTLMDPLLGTITNPHAMQWAIDLLQGRDPASAARKRASHAGGTDPQNVAVSRLLLSAILDDVEQLAGFTVHQPAGWRERMEEAYGVLGVASRDDTRPAGASEGEGGAVAPAEGQEPPSAPQGREVSGLDGTWERHDVAEPLDIARIKGGVEQIFPEHADRGLMACFVLSVWTGDAGQPPIVDVRSGPSEWVVQLLKDVIDVALHTLPAGSGLLLAGELRQRHADMAGVTEVIRTPRTEVSVWTENLDRPGRWARATVTIAPRQDGGDK
jgi:hypothetical protein